MQYWIACRGAYKSPQHHLTQRVGWFNDRQWATKTHRRSRIRVIGRTGSLQKMDSMNCCSSRCRYTATVGCLSCTSGPMPNLCFTGGRTCGCTHSGVLDDNERRDSMRKHSGCLSAHGAQLKVTGEAGLSTSCRCLGEPVLCCNAAAADHCCICMACDSVGSLCLPLPLPKAACWAGSASSVNDPDEACWGGLPLVCASPCGAGRRPGGTAPNHFWMRPCSHHRLQVRRL